MSHIDYGNTITSTELSADEWLAPAAQIRDYLCKLAQRTDLVATIGPDAALGSPACFIPSQAEIRIDSTVCLPGADAKDIHPSDALWRLNNPVFMGVTAHETGHAAHTRWKFDELQQWTTVKEMDVIQLLEEPRCEHRLLERASKQRPFLRASALDLILKDFTIPENPYGAAGACALMLARVDGGTLLKSDVEAVTVAIGTVLDKDAIAALKNLWQEFLAIGDNDIPSMRSVAKRWLEVIKEDPNNEEGTIFTADPKATPIDIDGEGWLKKAIGGASIQADGAIIVARAAEKDRRQRSADEANAERRDRAEKMADVVFHDDGATSNTVTAHRTGEREPTEEEHRAATELSQQLLTAEQRDTPEVDRSARQKPPGRLRTRAAAQQAAYNALGLQGHPEMFRARERVPDARGELTVATMLDISGSMGIGEKALASTQWVISTAGSRIGARTASVHFGAVVHGVAPLGRVEEKVQLYDCSDPWENFRDGFLAIDHEVQLLDGRGTRLLVICSDANFRKQEQVRYAQTAMTLCRAAGVEVLWLQLTRRFISTYGYGTVLDLQNKTPVEVARIVGAVAADRLASAQ